MKAERTGWRQAIAVVLSLLFVWTSAEAQQQSIAPQKPDNFVFIRPYSAAYVLPIRLRNSLRLRDLIRAGKLYLTVQDALALALENNIDLEIDRYNPLAAVWQVERAQAGGGLPGLPSFSTQSNQVASGQGAAGSQNAAGVSSGNNNNTNSGNTLGGSITQIGSIVPTLDPVFQDSQSYSHLSTPQSNLRLTQTQNWIESKHNYTESISQGLISGGQYSLSYNDSYLHENVPSDTLNPSNGVTLSLTLQQPLLQGFGVTLNSRTINVNKNLVNEDNLTFKTQVIGTVVNVLNLYYGLVADYEDVRAKQSAYDVAQRFFSDNKKQVQIGTMAPLDVTTAEAQVASTEQDLVVSQTTLAQQQVSIKDVLSRNGLADPLLSEVEVIPLDRIIVPEKDELPPMLQMVSTAMKNRADLAVDQVNLENLRLNALATGNGVLPQLTPQLNATQQGLSGQAQIVSLGRSGGGVGAGSTSIPPGFLPCPASLGGATQLCYTSDKYFVGGISNGLGQMLRRNFPSQNVGVGFFANARNRQAQADYSIDQLSIRQSELQSKKNINQITVDVSNQSIGLQQARVRYQAAVRNRILQEQLLSAEQKKFSLGASTTYAVVQQQRDLATSQSAEIAALVTYSTAHVSLDQTLGITLDANHVSLNDATSASVQRASALPQTLPARP